MAKTSLRRQKTSRSSFNEKDLLHLSVFVRRGVKYALFQKLANESSFSMHEWARFLHLSERSLQRYKNEDKTFDPIYSDKIMQIAILYQMGINTFGDRTNFNSWLETKNIALNKIAPKGLLDNTFGISLVKDELNRIQHGVLA